MSKSNFVPSYKWEGYDNIKPGGSLIMGSGQQTPPNSSPRHKLEDLIAHKQILMARHGSEEEFKRYSQRPSNMAASDIAIRPEEDHPREKHTSPHLEKNIPWDVIRRGLPKEGLFRSRNSGGRNNAPLAEQLSTHRSEKTLPSFLRNQNKSPDRFKAPERRGVTSKQSFRIIRRLGEGKFGNVFLARENWTGMIVALKVMPKKKILEDNLLVQFIRELKIQNFLDHPNIIKNYGFFSDQENFYTIMELGCDGQLYDIISTGETLSEESTSFIIGNLLEAINVMHRHKILHRDIKPENIVLVHGNVKLCDFGWAVNKKEELRSTFCGTPLYLSPELLQGSRYDEKVDLWAIGILAYELHLGSSPFNISEQEDLIKIVTNEVEFPPNKKISKEFKDFIREILKKNPKERMACKDLLTLEFIRKYRDLETCEELCQ